MSVVIDGSNGLTFPNSTTQTAAGLTTVNPVIASGALTFADATTQNTSGAVSKASSGYTKLPNGLIIQWGGTPFSGGGGTANITFPVAFPTACLAVTASVGRGSTLSGYMMSTQIGTFNTTSAAVIGNYDTGGTAGILPLSGNEYAAWIAFGY